MLNLGEASVGREIDNPGLRKTVRGLKGHDLVEGHRSKDAINRRDAEHRLEVLYLRATVSDLDLAAADDVVGDR